MTNRPHDCTDPLLELQRCNICNKMTCGWTRFDNVVGGECGELIKPWALCLECGKKCDEAQSFLDLVRSKSDACRKYPEKNRPLAPEIAYKYVKRPRVSSSSDAVTSGSKK